MRKPQQQGSWAETILIWAALAVLFLGMAQCSSHFGLGRATQGDIRAMERQIEERCR